MHTIDGVTCPHCSTDIPFQEDISATKAPRPGDVSLCFMCGCISIFNEDASNLRKPTPEELTSILRDTRVRTALMTLGTSSNLAAALDTMQEAVRTLPPDDTWARK